MGRWEGSEGVGRWEGSEGRGDRRGVRGGEGVERGGRGAGITITMGCCLLTHLLSCDCTVISDT